MIDAITKLYKLQANTIQCQTTTVIQGKMKAFFVPIVILLFAHYVADVSLQVILEVPGYGVLNGTMETSTYTDRPFYAFRSVYYAEKPTPENRFLVRTLHAKLKFTILCRNVK